ncbi:MAG: STT3 domain-containing protein, partial [Candidatus Thorarchaeota archaeon]
CAVYLNENGLSKFLNWYDQTTWYPYGRYMGKTMYIVIPMTAVFIYKIAAFLGINMTMLAAAYFTPAIFGTATVFVIYKIGSVLHSKRTGLFSALLVSISMGFISRTIVGFYDNECVGLFFMFLTYYFFMKGLSKDSMLNNVFAGLSLGLLSLTWGAYRYTFDFLALYALLMILLKKYSRRLLSTFATTIVLGITVGALIPRTGVARFALSAELLIPVFIIGIMFVIQVYQELQKNISFERMKRFLKTAVFVAIGLIIVTVIVLYALNLIQPIADKFLRTIFPTLAESLPVIDSVAENHPSAWASIFFNIYIMAFLMPLGFYFCMKKPNEKTVFLLLLGLTGIYFGGSMVRLSLIMTPAAALVSGYTIDEVLRPFALINQGRFTISRRKRRATRQIGKELISVAYVFFAIVLLMTTIFGVNMIDRNYVQSHELTPQAQYANTLIYTHDYQEAFQFIANNIAPYQQGDKPPLVMSWWDYGYQLRTMGNVTVMVDNGTVNSTHIGVVGAMLIHNETQSAKLCKQYGVDYVFVLSPGRIINYQNDIAKSSWMMKISEEYVPELGIVYENYYNEDPAEGEDYGFTTTFYSSVVYKLVAFNLNSNGYYGEGTEGGNVGDWRTKFGMTSAPDVTSLSSFELVFQSKNCVCRLYRVL